MDAGQPNDASTSSGHDVPPTRMEAKSTSDGAGSAREDVLRPLWEMIRRLPRYARLSALLARDPETPASAKAMLAVGGLYLVSPIDLVPGIIPVAGQLDDLYVVLAGLQQAIRITPASVVGKHCAAVDLTPEMVSKDLEAIRASVRFGFSWTFRQGGKAVGSMTRQVVNIYARAQLWKEGRNDQNSL